MEKQTSKKPNNLLTTGYRLCSTNMHLDIVPFDCCLIDQCIQRIDRYSPTLPFTQSMHVYEYDYKQTIGHKSIPIALFSKEKKCYKKFNETKKNRLYYLWRVKYQQLQVYDDMISSRPICVPIMHCQLYGIQ